MLLNKRLKDPGLVLTIALTFVFLNLVFGQVLWSPNSYLLAADGDGIKNYFTFAYHVKNGQSFHHFDGMLYPYGDLHILTDGHSFLSWLIKAVALVFDGVSNYSIGIINSLLLWSQLVTAIVLYRLLKTFDVHWWYACMGAMGIVLLSPQIDRLGGHLSLSYSFFVPLCWYWFRKYQLSLSFKYLMAVSSLLLIFYFTHPYLGLMGTMFILALGLSYFLIKRSGFSLSCFLWVLSSSLLPLILFQLYVVVLNNEVDRPLNRYLSNRFFADLGPIFVPHYEPLGKILMPLFGAKNGTWEAWCYVGIVSFLVLVTALIVGVVKAIRRRFDWKVWLEDKNIGLLASIMVLLFALGIPLKFFPQEWLDVVPSIRQIRVTARFAWVFYFVLNTWVLVLLFKWLKPSRKWLFYAVAVLYAFFNVWEGAAHFKLIKQKGFSTNYFNKECLQGEELALVTAALNEKDDAKAILSLPFYAIGAERLQLDHHDSKTFRNSMILSYHLGLPLFNNCMSRTSESKTENVLDILSVNVDDSPLLDLIGGDSQILLYNGKNNLRYDDEIALRKLQKNKVVGDEVIKRIPAKFLLEGEREEIINDFKQIKSSWVLDGLNYKKSWQHEAVFETFDLWGDAMGKVFKGGKSKKSEYLGFTKIWDVPKDRFPVGKKYLISFWYYSDLDSTNNLMFFTKEKKGDVAVLSNVSDTRDNTNTIGDWTYCIAPFERTMEGSSLVLSLKGSGKYNPKIYIDQFLIWDRYEDVYGLYEGWLYKNNYPITEISRIGQ